MIASNRLKFHLDQVYFVLGIQHNTCIRSNATLFIESSLLDDQSTILMEMENVDEDFELA